MFFNSAFFRAAACVRGCEWRLCCSCWRCRTVLYRTVPCYTALAVPYRVSPYLAVPYLAVPCRAVLCRAVPCCAVPCYHGCGARCVGTTAVVFDIVPKLFFLCTRCIKIRTAAAVFDIVNETFLCMYEIYRDYSCMELAMYRTERLLPSTPKGHFSSFFFLIKIAG